MSQHTLFSEFEYIAALLRPNDPAEAHGLLCGMLCADETLDSAFWIEQVMVSAIEDPGSARAVLLELFAATVSQLSDEQMGFSLLLPDDETALKVRVDALRYWCQGFLSGLGLCGFSSDWNFSADVQEFLDDLNKIARVGFEVDTVDEEDEEAYMQIVEYIRVGVMLVSQESLSPSFRNVLPSRLH